MSLNNSWLKQYKNVTKALIILLNMHILNILILLHENDFTGLMDTKVTIFIETHKLHLHIKFTPNRELFSQHYHEQTTPYYILNYK